jgi:hypothetical protein
VIAAGIVLVIAVVLELLGSVKGRAVRTAAIVADAAQALLKTQDPLLPLKAEIRLS